MKYGSEWFKGVANAIRNYGGTTAEINAQDFVSALKTAYNVSLKGYFDKNNSTQALFLNNKTLVNSNEYINVDDTKNVVNMAFMFEGCSALQQANLNMSWCVYATKMFCGCSALEMFENTDTRLLRIGGAMFKDCSSLREVRLKELDMKRSTQPLTNFEDMFYGCSALETLVVGYFEPYHYFTDIFTKCYSFKNLVILNVRTTNRGTFTGFHSCYHFTGETDSVYNPNGLRDAKIYVPDDKVQLVISEQRFGEFSDLVVPLSEYQGEY